MNGSITPRGVRIGERRDIVRVDVAIGIPVGDDGAPET